MLTVFAFGRLVILVAPCTRARLMAYIRIPAPTAINTTTTNSAVPRRFLLKIAFRRTRGAVRVFSTDITNPEYRIASFSLSFLNVNEGNGRKNKCF
ncbi:TPA: hypothetical protein DIV55_04375 [Patescibacteria group bacterium]|nr:hypothetical protein [Patescibacteria group bacterium]